MIDMLTPSPLSNADAGTSCEPIYISQDSLSRFISNVRAFVVSTHCGHAMCLQCAMGLWLRGVINGSPLDPGLELMQNECPVCRERFPRVAQLRQISPDGIMQRIRYSGSKPYIRNTTMDDTISALFEDICGALDELNDTVPHDPTVMELTSKYGRANGIEAKAYRSEIQCGHVCT